jgi:hypothetical protein
MQFLDFKTYMYLYIMTSIFLIHLTLKYSSRITKALIFYYFASTVNFCCPGALYISFCYSLQSTNIVVYAGSISMHRDHLLVIGQVEPAEVGFCPWCIIPVEFCFCRIQCKSLTRSSLIVTLFSWGDLLVAEKWLGFTSLQCKFIGKIGYFLKCIVIGSSSLHLIFPFVFMEGMRFTGVHLKDESLLDLY